MTPSSTRKVSAKFSPMGCLAILMVQPSRSLPLKRGIQPSSADSRESGSNARSRQGASRRRRIVMGVRKRHHGALPSPRSKRGDPGGGCFANQVGGALCPDDKPTQLKQSGHKAPPTSDADPLE